MDATSEMVSTIVNTYKISGKEIVDFLKMVDPSFEKKARFGEVRVMVRVPSGGDYSNEDLFIENEVTVDVRLTYTEREDKKIRS